ncbi:hypothetical protein AKO1_015845 [Acrasis kona]|uniref:CHCH domain-containing protein n=1 Tax=Acrasis kona TaxID=1008807 RepID=A0AAW2ZHS2_9EUKA
MLKSSLYFENAPVVYQVDEDSYGGSCEQFLQLYFQCEAKYIGQDACLKEKESYLACCKKQNQLNRERAEREKLVLKQMYFQPLLGPSSFDEIPK